jgi:ureidoacrylate peracid hydrolase
MHETGIPKHVVDSVIRRRGRFHVCEELDPAKTALIVIDMQAAFLAEGAPSEVPAARDIVPNINRLATAMRDTGGVVAWTQGTFADIQYGGWETFFRDMVPPELSARILENLKEGGKGHPLWPDLDVREGDLRIRKNRYSAFIPGASDLERQLREKGIDSVLIAGTLTNVCCESTARDAMQLGFRTVMVSDANATRTDEEHRATLTSFIQSFGDVRTTNSVIGMLETGARPLQVKTAT